MITIVLVIHVLIAVAMVGVILLQRSEGGALGIGGGGGGGGGLMTGRGAANLLTRSTAILAVAFFATSIALAFLSGSHTERRSILDQPATEAPAAPAPPSGPTVPLSE